MITAAHRQLDPSAALHQQASDLVDIDQLIESQHLGHGTSHRCDSPHAVLCASNLVLSAPMCCARWRCV